MQPSVGQCGKITNMHKHSCLDGPDTSILYLLVKWQFVMAGEITYSGKVVTDHGAWLICLASGIYTASSRDNDYFLLYYYCFYLYLLYLVL